MSYRRQTLQAIARLLSYPTESYLEAAELLFVILQSEQPDAAKCIAAFGEFAEPLDVHELEETFARTFDINPACALEVGWHLFGEEYARGMFLVRLRGEMRTRGLEESAELPDHIAHVLAVVAAMQDGDARRFVRACVQPAIEKMSKALEQASSPYQHVLRCLALVLEHEFGRPEASSDDERQSADRVSALSGDPLRDFPMPHAGPRDEIELVPLRRNFYDATQCLSPQEVCATHESVGGDVAHSPAEVKMTSQGNRHG